MKITFTIPREGGGVPNGVVIGDDASGAYVVSFRPSGRSEVQAVAAIRAAQQRKVPRGNAEVAVEVTVDRAHASRDKAMAFAVGEVRRLNARGKLVIESGGGMTALPEAVLAGVVPAAIFGVSTQVTYRFEAGQFA